jgi:uncharacterized spore protein YtfJ
MDIGDPIKTTIEKMSKILNINNAVGNPIETDEMLLFPITKMGMGFGTGMGEGKGLNMGGSGAGASGAAGMEPMAIIVVFKDVSGPNGIKVLSLKEPDPITRVIDGLTNSVIKIMEKDREMYKEMYKKRRSENRI